MHAINKKVNLHCHSIRKTLSDIDGISAKAAIDSCVDAGLLKDDSPQELEKLLFTQAQTAPGEKERTIFTFREA